MNSSTTRAAPQGPNEAPAREDRFAREYAAEKAIHIAALLTWVEDARSVGHNLEACADSDADVKAALDKWDVRYGVFRWTSEQADALHTLLSMQQDLIAEVGGLN